LARELAHALDIKVRPRTRRRWSDLIFKIVCILIAAFLILVFGTIGAFYLYMVT